MADTPTMEVRARLTADSAQFVQGMNNATAAANQLTQTASRVNSAMTGIKVAAAAGMGGLIALGVQSFMAAARVEELNYAMDAVGKATGLGYEALNQTAVAVKSMGIEMNVAQRSTLMFAQNNLKLADASKLARVAQDLAVLSGKNSTEEFQLLTYAVMTQRSELFKSAGVNGSIQGAYQKMASTLGISTKQLTAAQKVQAAMNMALEEGAKVYGTYEAAMQSASKVLRSFARLNINMQVAIGDALLKGIGPIIVAFYHLESRIITAMEGTGAFHDVITALTAVVVNITTPITNFINGINKYIEKFDRAKINAEKMAEALNNVLPIILAVGAAFAVAGGAALFSLVPVLGVLLGSLSPIGVGLTVLALTSTKVREAFVNLGKALMPLITVIKNAGFALLNVLGYAVGFVGKAINGLAVIVNVAVGFITRYIGVFKALGVAVGIVAIAFGAYKVTLIAIAAWETISAAAAIAYGVALNIMAGASLIAEAATGGLAAGFAALTVILELNPIAVIVGLIFAFIAAMVVLYNTNETARQVITDVFNKVANVVGMVIGTVLGWVGQFLLGIGSLMDVHNDFGNIVAKALQFVYQAYLTVVQFVLGYYKTWLDAIEFLTDRHNVFGKFIATVLNFIVGAVATVIQGIVGFIKLWLDALEYVTDRHNIFGKFIATVLNFIVGIVALAIINVVKFFKFWLDAFVSLFEAHSTLAKIVSTVFKFVAEFIGGAINFVLQIFANLLKGVATLIHWFEVFGEFVGKIWGHITSALGKAASVIGSIFETIVKDTIIKFLDMVKDKLADSIEFLSRAAKHIPLIGGTISSFLDKMSKSLRGVSKDVEEFNSVATGIATDKLASDANVSISLLTKVGTALADKTQSWGNYKTGVAGTLSTIANSLSKAGQAIVTFTGNIDALDVIDALVTGAKTASEGLQTVVDGLEKIKDVKVGDFIVDAISGTAEFASNMLGTLIKRMEDLKDLKIGDFAVDAVSKTAEFASNTVGAIIKRLQDAKGFDIGAALTQGVSNAAQEAGNALIGISAGIESFLSGDILGNAIDGLGGFIDSLKESVGFGDILASLKKKFEGNPANPNSEAANALGKNTAADIKNKADQMQKIRDAMTAGLDSIRKVMDDLQQAAKDFANSLKDTIVGFAGLKGVELPDGFIPQAKSLIENMQMKLTKATQFSAQIAQLQAMNLDAGALKQIIEAGPIQGAQLAASILGGGQEAVNQVSSLQKAIEFAGATIGNQGAVAAGYPAMIANAQTKYNAIANANLAVGGTGTTVNISEGAFKISVDTSKATTPEEATAIIENAISNSFATLAKELAAK